MNTRRYILLLAASALSACGTPVAISDYYDTDTASLQRFAHMDIIDESASRAEGYHKLGRVTGIYCKKGVAKTHEDTRVEAIDQVMLKAAQRGATQISTPACTTSGLDMANNCFEKIVCTAQAMRIP